MENMTEKEMRESEVPWPKSEDELLEYIRGLAHQGHDYGTAVYAMSMAAVATYYYMSHVVGASGFQASCADLDIIKRTRSIEGPFAFIEGHDMLYPQYDIKAKVDEYLQKWREWAGKEAQKMLTAHEKEDGLAVPEVVNHWKKLIKDSPL